MTTEASEQKTINDIRSAPTAVLYETARDIVQSQTAQSLALDSEEDAKIPKFNKQEIQLGRILGRGGFCVVHEVSKIKAMDIDAGSGGGGHSVKSHKSVMSVVIGMMKRKKSSKGNLRFERNLSCHSGMASTIEDGDKFTDFKNGSGVRFNRELISKTSNKKKSGCRYVLKQLAPELKQSDKIQFLKGTVDLAMEAKYLSSLEHPNIIEIFGVSNSGPFEDGFFLLLEKVTETLSKRMKKWMDTERTCKGITGFIVGSKAKIKELSRERYEASYSICSGGEFLHQKNIIFRDLKPDNIGFDSFGRLKIFDFGLAKELAKADMTEDGLYRLTGFTGAPRYMAPEVGLGQPYNLSADVYSWSMIMWFILALEPPFGFYTENMIADRVFRRGSRPAVFKSWPESIGNTMRQAWDANISARPSFTEISQVLRNELVETEPTLLDSLAGSER